MSRVLHSVQRISWQLPSLVHKDGGSAISQKYIFYVIDNRTDRLN